MKLEIPDEKKLVHEMVMPIRWGDMDMKHTTHRNAAPWDATAPWGDA